ALRDRQAAGPVDGGGEVGEAGGQRDLRLDAGAGGGDAAGGAEHQAQVGGGLAVAELGDRDGVGAVADEHEAFAGDGEAAGADGDAVDGVVHARHDVAERVGGGQV